MWLMAICAVVGRPEIICAGIVTAHSAGCGSWPRAQRQMLFYNIGKITKRCAANHLSYFEMNFGAEKDLASKLTGRASPDIGASGTFYITIHLSVAPSTRMLRNDLSKLYWCLPVNGTSWNWPPEYYGRDRHGCSNSGNKVHAEVASQLRTLMRIDACPPCHSSSRFATADAHFTVPVLGCGNACNFASWIAHSLMRAVHVRPGSLRHAFVCIR